MAGLLGFAAIAAAGDAATRQPPATGDPRPTSPAPPAPAAPAPVGQAPAAPAPVGQGPAPQPTPTPAELDEFVPTERISADDAVSFPTDI
jgi:hypothetical protein